MEEILKLVNEELEWVEMDYKTRRQLLSNSSHALQNGN